MSTSGQVMDIYRIQGGERREEHRPHGTNSPSPPSHVIQDPPNQEPPHVRNWYGWAHIGASNVTPSHNSQATLSSCVATNATTLRSRSKTTNSVSSKTTASSADSALYGTRPSIENRPVPNSNPDVPRRRLHRTHRPTLSLVNSIRSPSQPPGPLQDETNSEKEGESSHESRSKGFCVLSLDGGGCRGYLSLLNLKYLLRQLQPEGPIYPSRYFDLICGTSTGGLIAIILGVLHLDIDKAIELYSDLAGKVFAGGFSKLRYFRKDAGYSSKPLEAAITKPLTEHGEGRTLMVDQDKDKDKGCRVFVTTTHCDGVKRDVILVRSYPSPEGEHAKDYDHPWTIKEAALATAAAPTYFDRLTVLVNGTDFFFEDAGAHRANNPTKLAWKECQRLSELQRERYLFISLGTGSAPSQPTSGFFGFFKNKIDTFKVWVDYATDVDRVDRKMKKRADESEKMVYFRLNPPLDEKIDLGDSKKLFAMKSVAEKYNDHNELEFHEIAEKLREFQKAT